MNIHQQELLNLLKEVDTFCSKHNITYYCAGGTVIGAARHRGFIPWDDDIDIYMTRREFERFSDALKEHGPDNRVLEYYEANHEAQTALPRYHREENTMFCHFNLFGKASAGTFLDVFILDPIPDGYSERVEYISKLYSYNDLISPVMAYSGRLPKGVIDEYDRIKNVEKKEGRSRAVELISKEIFNYDESECNSYCLRWGSIPLIYPIEVIGTPSYLQFEDMEIPVPQDWYQYLVIHYGMEWMNLPYEETQHDHVNIVRYDMKYDYFYKKRDEVYSQDYLLDIHYRWKDAVVELQKQSHRMEGFLLDTHNALCRATINKKLAKKAESSVKALLDNELYSEILDAYEPCLKLQLSNAYMGQRMRHGSQYRWFFPLIFPLSEDELEAVLTSLIQERKERNAEKLIGVYERANIKSRAISNAAAVINTINEASKYYYIGEYEKAKGYIESIALWKKIPVLNNLMWLCDARLGMSEERANELEKCIHEERPNEFHVKAWGDYLWSKGYTEEATDVYISLMRDSRNGLFWMDIHDKGIDIPQIPTKRLTPFSETDVILVRHKLLDEIAEICNRNSIKYVLHPDLARRIFKMGNIGYSNGNIEVFMDAENAVKFREAFRNESYENRKLLSWLDGDDIRDFALIYEDTESVYCDFRRLEQWRNMGVFVTIRILRRKKAAEFYRKTVTLDEFALNLVTLENLDKKNLQSRKKRIAYALFSKMTPKTKKLLMKRMFTKSINEEQKVKEGDYYYYTNTKGLRPAKHQFKEELWLDTDTVKLGEQDYVIPKSAKKAFVSKETDLKNAPPQLGNFIYRSTEMSWDEIAPLIDEQRYLNLNWKEYAEARKAFRKVDAKIQRCWQMVLKEGEELELRENSVNIASDYKRATEADDLETAAAAIKIVDDTIKKYEEYDVPVYLEEELRECYEDFLDRTGQSRFKKKVISLWDKDKSEYYNNA